ncbi:4Fe-4S binding protein [Atlantibacter sp. RC6]|uniref:4Fe-4S binding protein n=1 Tax=Atlantibacter sp. RC6 TaxID=2587036 RepID=UPI00160636D0|nr:4Fe-4S binding protein [Atlantibacter sp. RC6]MBB3323412.1 ferredoxin [Atlantibacter sp. RC6]
MSLLSLNLNPAPPGAGLLCVRHKVKKNPCQACIDACPLAAISLTDGNIVIDDDKCNRCGHCLFACPTDALENISPIKRHWHQDRLTAPLSAQPACVDELLMWHFHYGIRAIELDTPGEGWLRAIAELNLRLKALEQPVWRLAQPAAHPVNTVRRQWLRMANETDSGSVPYGRRALRDAVTFINHYSINFHAERCYLCGACARICPEQAIRLEADHITLDNARCTGCGQCTAVCFPNAIDSEKAINHVAERRLAVVQQRCATCGQLFSAWTAEQSTCPFCRQHTIGMR